MVRKRKSSKTQKTSAKKKKSSKKKAAKKKVKKTNKSTKPKAKGRRGKRYSAKQQVALLDKYHDLRQGGNSADKAAKKVGVSYLTLLKWEKASGKKIKSKRGRPPGKKSALKKALKSPKRGRPPKQKQESLTLVTPTGYRIEGFSPKDIIKVLRAMK